MADHEQPPQDQHDVQQHLNASQLGGNNNAYMMHPQHPQMYGQEYDPAAMHPQDMMMNNMSMESGNNYEPMDAFPIEALAPFNQGLAAFAGDIDNGKGQKLKEARLMEALERQTSLLDSIAQSYQKNREMRHKADLRKLKNRLEKLENEKLFRELEIQQMQSANDIAHQNNQLIFSHLNAQAQLKANPIVLNTSQSVGSMPPFALHAAFNSLPPLGGGLPGYLPGPMGMPPRPMPFGPGPQWNPQMSPGMRPPPMFRPDPAGPRSGPYGMPPPPVGFNKGLPFKLPPINSKHNKKSKRTDSSGSVDSDDSMVDKSKKKGKKKDVNKYLDQVFDQYKKR